MTAKQTNGIQSVERALLILQALAKGRELGITELSRAVELGKSTTYRLVSTLESQKYVQQNANGKYSLTLKLFELGNAVVNHMGIRPIASSYMEDLAAKLNETVNLAVLEKGEVIYIDRIESQEPLRIGLNVGTRVPVYCSGLGKAILAFLSERELEDVLNHTTWNAYTDSTYRPREIAPTSKRN